MYQYNTPSDRLPTCGVYISDNGIKFLPIVALDVHTSIVSSTSRTVLTQTFATTGRSLKNVRYVFPLYDGVSVAGFKCTIGSRVIKGVVKERHEAKRAFKEAVARGKTAGLLEQSLEASDVFTTSLGNIPSRNGNVKVEITYLGELKHDAQVDGLRFTIPTSLAQRYGKHSIAGSDTNSFQGGNQINITIDADVSSGSAIKSIQSPSHPISVNIGTLSTATSAPPSLQRAHATLSQGSAELGKDFVIQIVATGLGDPMAVLETHPTIPNQRALMTTLVPRFNLPMEMTEVVFMCDRSGSMGDGRKIPNIIDALKIFLKSLPVGVKFNICSFGSHYSFLWERSMTYEEGTLDMAMGHVSCFAANFGGTEMFEPMEEIFKRRYKDLNLEVFLLTDGGIWQQEKLFQLINAHVSESKGAIRLFTLGVGRDASHALIEGVARAGNGFAQTVGEDEKMDKMLVRMLKGALTPHITDYSLEIKYESRDTAPEETSDDFEVIERVMDAMTLELPLPRPTEEHLVEEAQRPISLFDQSVQDADLEISNTSQSAKINLPLVTVPRYLQAPFQIPPLFPFSRTTVYVLLSDSTPNRQPKSVILRGTSSSGPLSLEIPVATLTERGTTIHQLAARKATRELEDGRGWIFHVKNQDGKLLQQQFDGQFSDMVKREAVRLGTQYQVSGRWCSFVAIQDSEGDANWRQKRVRRDEDEDEDDEADEEVGEFDELTFDDLGASAKVRRSARANAAAGIPMPIAYNRSLDTRSVTKRKKISTGALQAGYGGAQQAAMQPATVPMPKVHSPPFAFGAMDMQGSPSIAPQEIRAMQQPMGGGFGLPPSRPKPARVSVGGFATSDPLHHDTLQGAQSNDMGGFDSSGTDLLSALSALQTFAGNWQWNPRLEGVLGITAQLALEKSELPSQYIQHMDVLATLCAVVFLKMKLASEKDAWELLVQKAEDWLKVQTRADVLELQKGVKDKLFTN